MLQGTPITSKLLHNYINENKSTKCAFSYEQTGLQILIQLKDIVEFLFNDCILREPVSKLDVYLGKVDYVICNNTCVM